MAVVPATPYRFTEMGQSNMLATGLSKTEAHRRTGLDANRSLRCCRAWTAPGSPLLRTVLSHGVSTRRASGFQFQQMGAQSESSAIAIAMELRPERKPSLCKQPMTLTQFLIPSAG